MLIDVLFSTGMSQLPTCMLTTIINKILDSCQSRQHWLRSGPKVIKIFPCSTQLSIKFFLLKNFKVPTIVGVLTFMSMKNSIPGLSEPEKC